MSERQPQPTGSGARHAELAWIRRRYRAITAPPDLAARVAAAVAPAGEHAPWRWHPVAAAAAILVILVAVGPRQVGEDSQAVSRVPSLAQLSRAMPKKPAAGVPSLARVRGLQTPVAPQRPVTGPSGTPRSEVNREFPEFNWLKENTHG